MNLCPTHFETSFLSILDIYPNEAKLILDGRSIIAESGYDRKLSSIVNNESACIKLQENLKWGNGHTADVIKYG